MDYVIMISSVSVGDTKDPFKYGAGIKGVRNLKTIRDIIAIVKKYDIRIQLHPELTITPDSDKRGAKEEIAEIDKMLVRMVKPSEAKGFIEQLEEKAKTEKPGGTLLVAREIQDLSELPLIGTGKMIGVLTVK
jgi:hypothetical protein